MRITKQHHQPKSLAFPRRVTLVKQLTLHSLQVSQAVSNLSDQKSRKTAGLERRYTTQRHAQGGVEPNETFVLTDGTGGWGDSRDMRMDAKR